MPKSQLSSKSCVPCHGSQTPLKYSKVKKMLQALAGWSCEKDKIRKTFHFKNYYETTAFVNAAIWIAHQEDHHPDITFGYKQCEVVYSTHSVKGLTKNDFICASKLDALLPLKG